MDINKIFQKYEKPPLANDLEKKVNEIKTSAASLYTTDNLRKIMSVIDLTTLKPTDNKQNVGKMVEQINGFHSYTRFIGIPNIAAICIYPCFVPFVKKKLTARRVKLASVAAGFPASQTFQKIKIAEAQMAVAKGAQEIDIVMPVGKFLEDRFQEVFNEIETIKKTIKNAHLKVILETGALETPEDIKIASIIAMQAGADFIKTSTGMLPKGASLNAVYLMAQAVKEHYKLTGKKVGIKPAGGISTARQAIEYMAVIHNLLPIEWLSSPLFRIGASRLANNVLSEIKSLSSDKPVHIEYF